MMIGSDCTGSCKSNYYTKTTTTAFHLTIYPSSVIITFWSNNSHMFEPWAIITFWSNNSHMFEPRAITRWTFFYVIMFVSDFLPQTSVFLWLSGYPDSSNYSTGKCRIKLPLMQYCSAWEIHCRKTKQR